MAEPATAEHLHRTQLYALNVELGGKIVPFAGYEMPVQFPAGILKEHLHTRERAGDGRRHARRTPRRAREAAASVA